MATVEVRCRAKLSEPIVLASQQDTFYPPLRWTLSNGDNASVEMEVPEETIRAHQDPSKTNWFINTKVDVIRVWIELHDVEDNDTDRLYLRHASAKTYKAHFQTASGPVDQSYQEALAFGQRVGREILEGLNLVLRFVRVNYGQHWIQLVSGDEAVQNFLDSVRAEWREGSNPWSRLLVSPPVVSVGPVFAGSGNLYLETADWDAVQKAIAANEMPADGFALISEARERYEQGDRQVAIINLNSALEWAVERFLRQQLGPRIPPESLDKLLEQTHGRLLSDWVLPLSRSLGLALDNNEWPNIRKIQQLRREAGHPTVRVGIDALYAPEFWKLVKDATSAMVKMTGLPKPKAPPPMTATVHCRTV